MQCLCELWLNVCLGHVSLFDVLQTLFCWGLLMTASLKGLQVISIAVRWFSWTFHLPWYDTSSLQIFRLSKVCQLTLTWTITSDRISPCTGVLMFCRLSLAISMPVAAASLTETVKVIIFSARFRSHISYKTLHTRSLKHKIRTLSGGLMSEVE